MINQEIAHDSTKKVTERDAGCFSSWLRRTRRNLITEEGISVACEDCIGCCTSSYFIHIRPEEVETLSLIDRKLLFPAPGAPKGHKLLGYFKNGHCPMQNDGRCKIYLSRPVTCRNYDCRIFAAAGILAGEADKVKINERVVAWRFRYPFSSDRAMHEAVKQAAAFLQTHLQSFPAGFISSNPSQVALFAIKAYKAFMPSSACYLDPETLSDSERVAGLQKQLEAFGAR